MLEEVCVFTRYRLSFTVEWSHLPAVLVVKQAFVDAGFAVLTLDLCGVVHCPLSVK